MAKKRVNKAPQKKKVEWNFPFTKKNYMILAVGFVVILVGYGLMATGISEDAAVVDGQWNNPWAVTVAPIVLLIGYLVVVPYGILKLFGKKADEEQTSN